MIDLPVSSADQIGGVSPAWISLLVGLAAGIIGIVAAAFLFGEDAPALAMGLLIGVFASLACAIILSTWQNYRWVVSARAFRARFQAAGPGRVSLAPGGSLREEASRLACWPRSFLDLLCRCGCYGVAIRLLPDGSSSSMIAPLDVSFEPMVVDESDGAFLEIARPRGRVESRSAESDVPNRVIRNETMSTVGRRLRRARQLGKFRVLTWVIALIVFKYLAVAALVISLLYWALRDPSPRSQLWAFPGGLLLPRHGKAFRCEAALAVYHAPTARLALARPGEKPHFVTVTPGELEFALRAWLSTAPSPSDEMLASFMGGG